MRLKNILTLLVILLITGCASRNLTYFSDIESNSDYSVKIEDNSELKIQPFDRIKIIVNSPSPESNLLFNGGILTENIESINVPINRGIDSNNFLVNKEGVIEFPVIGEIKLGGMTFEKAREEMKFHLKAHIKDPSVNMFITNFKISVLGEVKNPSNFTIDSERINVFEAIGLAGDLTPYGKRENVLLLRERNGIRNIYRINLNEKKVLNSPYYYLEQNDIVYIEADKQKAKEAKNNTTTVTIISVAASILVAVIFNYQNLFN